MGACLRTELDLKVRFFVSGYFRGRVRDVIRHRTKSMVAPQVEKRRVVFYYKRHKRKPISFYCSGKFQFKDIWNLTLEILSWSIELDARNLKFFKIRCFHFVFIVWKYLCRSSARFEMHWCAKVSNYHPVSLLLSCLCGVRGAPKSAPLASGLMANYVDNNKYKMDFSVTGRRII